MTLPIGFKDVASCFNDIVSLQSTSYQWYFYPEIADQLAKVYSYNCSFAGP